MLPDFLAGSLPDATPDLEALLREVVGRGGHMAIRGRGVSMQPAIAEGDVMVVGPPGPGGPRPGEIVLWAHDGRLVAHRVVGGDRDWVVTRGDGVPTADPPIPRQAIVGVLRELRVPRWRRAARATRAGCRRLARFAWRRATSAPGAAVALVAFMAVLGAARPAHAQCIVPTTSGPNAITVNGNVTDWDYKCQYQRTDPLNDTTPASASAGRDIQWFSYTHDATGANAFVAFRMRGALDTTATYRMIFAGSGATATLNTTFVGGAWVTNGTIGTTSFTVPTAASGSVIEYGGGFISGALLSLFQNATVQFQVRSGASVIDSITPLTGVDPDSFPLATAITLRRFDACAGPGGVEIRWRTAAEHGTLGFFVHRDTPDGPRVNSSPVPGQLTSPVGARYRLRDPVGTPTSRYFLEEVAQDGTHGYGPSTQGCADDEGARFAQRAARAPRRSFHRSDRSNDDAFARIETGGIYRLSTAALADAGVGRGRGTRGLRLDRNGVAWPAWPTAYPDAWLFVAATPDSTTRREDAYRVRSTHDDDAGPRRSVAPTRPGDRFAEAFTSSVHIEEHHTIFPGAPAEDRFPWGLAWNAEAPIEFPFAAPGHVGGAASVTVELLGASYDQQQSHRAEILVNGIVVGAARFTGVGPVTVTATLPAGVLREAGNQLGLRVAAPESGGFDIVALLAIDLGYQHAFRANGDSLEFTSDARQSIEVTGFSATPALVDMTVPGQPVLLDGAAITSVPSATGALSFSLRFRDATARGPRRYLAAVPRDPATLESSRAADVPPDSADYVVIHGAGLGPALAPLLDLRRRQGLTALAVDVEAIFDRFGHGQHDPGAITSYLSHLHPAPRFVLLVGDATIDPHDYLGTGTADVVPTVVTLAPGFHVYATSDADLLPADRRASIALGRLPAASPAALAAVVAKIVAYETRGPASGLALLAADGVDPIGHVPDLFFRAQSDSVAGGLPRSLTPLKVYVPEQGAADLMTAFARAPELVIYHGHASALAWSTQSLLTLDDVARLPPVRPFVLTTVDCWDGLFALPWLPSLAEALVMAPAGGAVAALAASSLVDQADDPLFDEALFPRLGDPDIRTVGQWWTRTRTALERAGGRGAAIAGVYNLLGDPATPLPGR